MDKISRSPLAREVTKQITNSLKKQENGLLRSVSTNAFNEVVQNKDKDEGITSTKPSEQNSPSLSRLERVRNANWLIRPSSEAKHIANAHEISDPGNSLHDYQRTMGLETRRAYSTGCSSNEMGGGPAMKSLPEEVLEQSAEEKTRKIEHTQKNSVVELKIRYNRIKHPEYAKFREVRAEKCRAFAEVRGISVEEYLKLLDTHAQKFLPKNREVCMRIDPRIWEKILKDNDTFKSMYETKTSKGVLDINRRLFVEKERLGNYSRDMPNKLRPIYGYIATSEHPRGIPGREYTLDHYGRIAIVFKDEIKQRTTFTVGDSISSPSVRAVPLENPNGDCFSLWPPIRETDSIETIRELDPLNIQFENHIERLIPYVEAQIHYGASLQDIKYVVIPESTARVERDFANEFGRESLMDLQEKANISFQIDEW